MIGDQKVTCVFVCQGGQWTKTEKKSHKKICLYPSALFCTSFSFQSANKTATADWVRTGRQWQKIYVSLSLLDTSSLTWACSSKVYVLAGYVFFFYAGSEKLHCVSLLAYANARRGCGRWGGAPPSSSREKGSFAANQKELQKPILTCSSKDAEEFLLLLNAGLCFPRIKTQHGWCCYRCEWLERGKHNLTLTPWDD